MPAHKTLLTKEGLAKIKKQIEELEQKIIPEILDKLHKAKADGDLRENNAYISAKEDLATSKDKLTKLKEALRTAEVVVPKGKKVMLGSEVTIEINGKKRQITITSSLEVDPLKNKISVDSPIGKTILGAKKGEERQLPNGMTVKIIDIKH